MSLPLVSTMRDGRKRLTGRGTYAATVSSKGSHGPPCEMATFLRRILTHTIQEGVCCVQEKKLRGVHLWAGKHNPSFWSWLNRR